MTSLISNVCFFLPVFNFAPPGQERFTWMTRVYYRDAKGCVIVFDLSSRSSFLSVPKWKRDLDAKVTLMDGSPVPCLLLANKVSGSGIRFTLYPYIRK